MITKWVQSKGEVCNDVKKVTVKDTDGNEIEKLVGGQLKQETYYLINHYLHVL